MTAKAALSKKNKHGLCKHPLYTVWRGMKGRCYSKKHKGYKNYGARGISICDEWRTDFKNFYEWCMKNGWKMGLEIDRRENNDNYTPSNCRITTKENNRNNRRVTINVTYKGEIKLLTEWAKELGVDYSWLRRRVVDKNILPDIAFIPPKKNNVNILLSLNGQQKTLSEWCNGYGVDLKTVWNRIYKHKWSLLDALTKPHYTRTKSLT